LFIGFGAAKSTAAAGKRVKVGYVSTTTADVKFEVRKGAKLIATINTKAAEGRNTISWDGKVAGKPATPGAYTLSLSASSPDGQTASDSARLKLVRR
jgi:hypothetical protein